MENNVNHPSHYQSDTGLECKAAIRAALGREGYINFCRGNVIKYLWRDKPTEDGDNTLEDTKKAEFYIREIIRTLEE